MFDVAWMYSSHEEWRSNLFHKISTKKVSYHLPILFIADSNRCICLFFNKNYIKIRVGPSKKYLKLARKRFWRETRETH